MNNNNSDDNVPSLNQFKHCSQILSFSLAQHREKCESIPLLNALPLIAEDKLSKNHSSVIKTGNKIYKEAMAMAETSLAPSSDGLLELRSQPRINVTSLIDIKVPATGLEWQGHLSNISWGGLRIHANELIGDVDELVEISLPYPEAGDIHIQGTIVRYWENKETYSIAIRFTKISQKNETKLNKLLELLLNEDNDQLRKDIRFSQRIDISYWDTEELKATLEDISKGGMMVTTPNPITLNKSIKVSLDGPNDTYTLSLRARVIRLEDISTTNFKMYQMALEFEHSTEELRSIVHGLIQGMMNKGIMNKDSIPKLN